MKVVIYSRGTSEEVAQQRQQCQTWASQQNIMVVGLACDSGDGIDGWEAAWTMVRAGTADKILVASRVTVPDVVESVTMRLVGRRPRRVIRPG